MSHEAELLEAVLSCGNMQMAWAAVEADAGSAGVDRMTIEATRRHLVQHWPAIGGELRAGKYKPAAVRAVRVAKANGGERPLGTAAARSAVWASGVLP